MANSGDIEQRVCYNTNIMRENSFEVAVNHLQAAGEQVAGYMTKALEQIALEQGGEDFAASIAAAAMQEDDSVWPNPDALRQLEDHYPGSGKLVFDRMEVIQQQTHAAELQASRPRMRRLGKHLVQGAGLLGEGLASLYPSQRKRR
ncbi:MAG: hypothetical protein JWN38_26 [Candidatus Saccharibacteria bacterium]|nr:hypothetical protein [Candidatus Saccharibacteria bacterium]